MTYRIKEVKYINGNRKFFPEFSLEDVEPFDESVIWYRCFGTEKYGYLAKQDAVNAVVFDKRMKSDITETIIHKVDDNN